MTNLADDSDNNLADGSNVNFSWYNDKFVMLILGWADDRNEEDDKDNEQARKSSEDTHFTEYARFEKVWAG